MSNSDRITPESSSAEDAASGRVTRRQVLRGALTGAAAVSVAPGVLAAAASAGVQAKPVRGGRLRVAMVGDGNSETLDFNRVIDEVGSTRLNNIYEGLFTWDRTGKRVGILASGLSTNANASVWKVKVRPNVVFHNGKKMTADDVVYSFRYMLDPKNKSLALTILKPLLKASNIRRLDASTVEFRLNSPNSMFPDLIADRLFKVVPVGITAAQLDTSPIGTGPFKFKSWTRGERSLFVRHDAYWLHPLPYLDELEIISINDATARLNALVAGQIDALGQLDLKLLPVVKANSKLQVLEIAGATYTNFYMLVDVPPFNDVRVRQAFRLMVDRKQIIDNALGGHGRIGNDLPSWFDPDYARSLPQRPYDPEKAKSLLKAAGHEGLKVTLSTSEVAPAMLDSSTLLAQQAKAAGVTIDLKKWPTDQYWVRGYIKEPFGCSNWGGRGLAAMFGWVYQTGAPDGETHWSTNVKWQKLLKQTQATTNTARRHAMLLDLQKTMWDEDGTILWGFLSNVDALSTRVKGLKPSVIRPLGDYDFKYAYLA
jgi:peptide/nickel transport system substrate-binding protein